MVSVRFSAPENITTLKSFSSDFPHTACNPVRHQGLGIPKGMEKWISPHTGAQFYPVWALQYGGKGKTVKK